jgi:uncharacterized protein (TIGR03067 family)
VRVPDGAGLGTAKLTMSFDGWKDGRVASAAGTIRVEAALPKGMKDGVNPPSEAVKKDLDAFQGDWEVEWIEIDGKRTRWRKGVLAFRGTKRLTRKEGSDKYEAGGSFKIDPSCTPKTIDFMNPSAKSKDDRIEGIYQIQGDTMLWCVYTGEGVKNRPLEFRTKPGSKNMLVKLRRIKVKKGQ